jgi:hypothetical protein
VEGDEENAFRTAWESVPRTLIQAVDLAVEAGLPVHLDVGAK